MQNKLFSIGELSKLYQIPIKTLRYYDDIQLLKPAIIDPNNHYRYYSVEQLIVVDLIKNSKLMGLSLAEIKEAISQELSIAQIEAMVSQQIEAYEAKIKGMQHIQESMKQYLGIITQSKAHPLGEVQIHEEHTRWCRGYPYRSESVEETEVNLRKAFLESKQEKPKVYPIFGASSSWDSYVLEKHIAYRDIKEYLYDEEVKKDNEVTTLKAGRYAVIYFDAPAYDKSIYYEKIKAFIDRHHLEVEGNFNETWLIPRLDHHQKESTLIRLDIRIKDNKVTKANNENEQNT